MTLVPIRSSHPAVLAPLVGVCQSGTVVVDGASGRTGKEVMEKLLERGTASELATGQAAGLGAPPCPLSRKSRRCIKVIHCTIAAWRLSVAALSSPPIVEATVSASCNPAAASSSADCFIVLEVSFHSWTGQVYDSILVKKHEDSAFQSKDFAIAVECYSRFIDTGAMVSPTMLAR
ncbi:hypothetical protein E2562_000406 [Oryza meyeriana var. granulata]|uniref:Serine/threonine-protein kinase BSK1-like TPR repeats domain-containing protein n=1 Tax=Oryza meyeriana var. granulata TaxID=110450 RepID=A0A6G1CB47_9ORYZ|nr:hypothetical protein E2562_000406 [Oryza meyeriana var. granulata]